MDVQPKAPKPLTEAQRNEVRNLLKQLSASSASRRSKVGNKNPLSRKKARKVKRIENVFEGIEEGKTVNGFTEVGPDCCTLTFVQRVRVVLLPFHYDRIAMERKEWIDMIEHYCGCQMSVADAGTREYLRFVVEGNAPVRCLHVYLEAEEFTEKMILSNFLYGT